MFTTYVEKMTPEKAAKILEGNTANRKMRTSHVKHLAQQMGKMRWKKTPTPIVITKRSRTLIDGQHRLQAIIMSGASVAMTVTEIDDHLSKEIFDVIDQNKVRSLEDITGENSKVIKPISYLLRAGTKIKSPTPADMYPFIESDIGARLKIYADQKSSTKLWKTTQFLAAMAVAIVSEKISWSQAHDIFVTLTSEPITEWPPIFATLYCKLAEETGRGLRRSGMTLENDVFMRSYYAFLNVNSAAKTIRIHKSFVNEMKADVFSTLYQISPETFD